MNHPLLGIEHNTGEKASNISYGHVAQKCTMTLSVARPPPGTVPYLPAIPLFPTISEQKLQDSRGVLAGREESLCGAVVERHLRLVKDIFALIWRCEENAPNRCVLAKVETDL